MSFRCDNCGSTNHAKFDCSKPYNGWREREPVKRDLPFQTQPPASLELEQAETAAKRQPKPVKAVLQPPRWPGGPKICSVANLPSFKDAKAAFAYHETNAPGLGVCKQWGCESCGGFHYLSKPVGDEMVADVGPRQSKATFPFMREKTRQEMDERAHRAKFDKAAVGDLPKQAVDRSAPVKLPKAAKKQLASKQVDLW